jgi:hypothetical protein
MRIWNTKSGRYICRLCVVDKQISRCHSTVCFHRDEGVTFHYNLLKCKWYDYTNGGAAVFIEGIALCNLPWNGKVKFLDNTFL